MNSTPKNLPKVEIPPSITHHNTDNQEENVENTLERGKSTTANTKTPLQKPFNLEAEISKLKISIPLSELAKHDVYMQQIQRSLQMPEIKDDVNVLDDMSELLFGPEVNGKPTYGAILSFYVSLHIHDKVLHNVMFDSGASHNLMPKAVMEKLNLDITRSYTDFFSFDSS